MKRKNRRPEKKLARYVAAALLTSLCFGATATAYAADLPAFFDWRLNDPTDSTSGTDSLSIVPEVKDQGHFGTCWAFAGIGSYESSYFRQLKEAKERGENINLTMPDFSEHYLAYMTYAKAVNEDATDNVLRYEGAGEPHPYYDAGGYAYQVTMSMINKGVVKEDEVSYQPFLDEWANFKSTTGEKIQQKYTKYIHEGTMAYDQANKQYSQEIASEWGKIVGNASYGAVDKSIAPTGGLHDSYVVPIHSVAVYRTDPLSDDQLAQIKSMIKDKGAVVAISNADNKEAFTTYGEWYSTKNLANHAQTLVGWDDDYVFKGFKDTDGSDLKGAFIMRNNWGKNAGKQGGYGYISYKDNTLQQIYFHEAELDSARYTINANNAPAVQYELAQRSENGYFNRQPVASYFQSEDNQFLKAAMVYASSPNMKYEIKVREGTTPGDGNVLYTQSGTFGEDGTAAYAGFRTVDFDKYIMLPKGKDYVVEATTISTDGTPVSMFLQASGGVYGSKFTGYKGYNGVGKSYYYDYDEKAWVEELRIDWHAFDEYEQYFRAGEDLQTEQYVVEGVPVPTPAELDLQDAHFFLVARGKETNLANGGDFTVAYLDDTGSNHSSVINLGKAAEIYGTDAAQPNRKTLSNMTVDLSADVANFYGGTITGEGAVTKTGAGSLTLAGANTYTGMTTVNEGTLAINGSVAGDAKTTGTGTLMGSGKIGGVLNNQGIAVAGYNGDGNLRVKELNSEGGILLSQVNSAGQNTKFAVENTANVNKATVMVEDALPGEYEIVTAGTLTGTVANDQNNPLAVSALVNQYGEASGNVLNVKTVTTDNLAGATAEEQATLAAMNEMSRILRAKDDTAGMNELRPLFAASDTATARKSLAEIGSNDATQILGMAQQSTVAAQAISDRLSTAFSMTPVDVAIPTSNLKDGEDENALTMPVDMPVSTVGDGWVKFTKHWGEMKSGANYHGSAISGGYDRAVNPYWRVGTFLSYNDMGYGAESASGSVYDTRFGFYAGYHKNADDAYIYVDYGWQRNRLRRSVSVMGMTASANYNSHLIELGGEYKHDLHATDGKMWHVSPFVGAQLSHLTQTSYGEEGAGVFNQQVDSQGNTYFAMQTGLEFKRYVNKGSYALRLGVKHAFSGADPEINFNYEGNPGSTYTLKGSQDKTHFVMSLTGDTEFKKGWILGGDLRFQKGGHDRDLAASMMIRRVW